MIYNTLINSNLDIKKINKKRLNLLKKTCGIVNIGRQSVLDYEILCKSNKLFFLM